MAKWIIAIVVIIAIAAGVFFYTQNSKKVEVAPATQVNSTDAKPPVQTPDATPKINTENVSSDTKTEPVIQTKDPNAKPQEDPTNTVKDVKATPQEDPKQPK